MTYKELKARESALLSARYHVGKHIEYNESHGICAINAYAEYDEITEELEDVQMQLALFKSH